MQYSAIEALETRIAPAAVLGAVDVFVDATTVKVSLSAGVLKIIPLTGATDLNISVEQLPDGSFLISDLIGDDDLETTADLHGVVKGLNVGLSNGSDTLTVTLDSDYLLNGSVVVNTGLGDDQVSVLGGLVRGNVTVASRALADVEINDTTVLGLVSGAAMGGSFHFGANATAGTLKSTGFSDHIVEGYVVGNAILGGKVGETSFQVGSVGAGSLATIGGNLTVAGVAAGDDFYLGHAFVRGALSVNLGAGDNLTTFSTDATILGLARVTGTTGADTVQIGAIAGAGPTIHGRLTVALGSGANTLTAASGVISGGFSYSGTTGNDTVVLGVDLTVYNDARIALGDGNNAAVVESFSALSKFSLTGGKQADQVWISTVGAGYTVGAIALGLGDDALTVLGSADFFSTFSADGGVGTDTLTVNSAVIASGFLGKKFETVS